MIQVDIPGYRVLQLTHLVMDYNGTLAVDGEIAAGVAAAMEVLASQVTIHVITADTFGLAANGLKGCPVKLSVLPPGDQDVAKLDYVERLGAAQTAAVGNGRNDRRMLKKSALGIAVVLGEGPAVIRHVPVHDRQADHLLQSFQMPEYQCPVGPGAGQRNVQVVAVRLGPEPAAAARAGAAVGGDPVTKLRRAALEVALVRLGVVPLVFPFSVHQKSHNSILRSI